MSIKLITQYPFPYGLAQTNRLIAIARGLIYAKADLQVVCLKPTESVGSIRNLNAKGIHEGVSYSYSAGTTVRNKNHLIRMFHYYYGFWHALMNIVTVAKVKKPDVVIIGVVNNIRYLSFILACRFRGIKIIHERSEYPFLSYSNSFIQQLSFSVYRNFICRRFDGMITITHALAEYYRPYLNKRAKEYLLPILVEPERFAKQVKSYKQRYLAYCGSMGGTKDGVNILIEAFKEISSEYPELKLYLIGSTDFQEFNSLKNRINSLQLENRIIFTGRVERDDLPSYLLSAEALCLARPTSKQAEGGFPTKLGEYLCSGRPVVVTKVGEIPDYLKDGENAYLAEPNDIKDFAGKLHEALLNSATSNNIGKNGKKLAQEVFNYQAQGIKLATWLKELIK